jgi:hypothetical protein
LFGSIPAGVHEGVLWLTRTEDDAWRGVYVAASSLERSAAAIRLTSERALEITIGSTTPLHLRREGGINSALLERISIIGHRGLNLGQPRLMNSIEGIRNCWLFGCSGIEIDVTIPYDDDERPLTTAPRIYHPPEWRAEITGFDSVAASRVAAAPEVRQALDAAREVNIPFVYLDPKLKWLVKRNIPAARESIKHLVETATAHLISAPKQIITIGSETSGAGQAADLLTEIRRGRPWPDRLFWALEVTRGTDVESAYHRATDPDPSARPEVLSYNLLRVPGGGGGLLRLFVGSMPEQLERSFAQASQARIYWTAFDRTQFEGAVRALERTSGGGTFDAAIITPYPHRLAFYLATTSGR